MNPLECILGPSELAFSGVVEDAKGYQIHIRCNSKVNTVVGTDDTGNMGSMKSCGRVVVGTRVVLGKVPATDDLVTGPESLAQGHVIKCDAAIDDCDRLAPARKAVLSVNLVPTRLCVGVA